MAVLNDWQKITRVLPGLPFGDGSAGTGTISSDPNVRATFSGSSGSTSGTAGSTSFSNGDVVFLYQTQGTGAGQWEINKVVSGGGTTSLTFMKALQYTYVTGAQIIKIPMYDTATVSGFTVTSWNGSTGGISVICGKTSITVSGSIDGNGTNASGTTPGARKGFRGGGYKQRGEGIGGDVATSDAYLNAGGGAQGPGDRPGGGGGNGTAGGSTSGPGGGGASGGSTSGSADLITMTMGGAGGGGTQDYTPDGYGTGGGGGQNLVFITKNLILNATCTFNGGNGSYVASIWGGGGAGGSVLAIVQTATLGTNRITATGGSSGAAGGVGRIAVHHSGTVTGTTNPTFYDQPDPSLVEGLAGGSFIFNLL